MFFNDDILYRNGALALVWLAGNEMLKGKNLRSKEIQRILKSNVIRICADLRGLFPRMGTAHGIPLIKMGVLAKGAGQIYCLKMNVFARDVLTALTNLNKPIISAEFRISMPKPKKIKAKTVRIENAEDELSDPNQTVFGRIPGHDWQVEGELVQDFGSPRALPPPTDYLELYGPMPPFRMQVTPPRDNAADEERARKRHKKSSKRTAAQTTSGGRL